jgi:hypothetical protein
MWTSTGSPWFPFPGYHYMPSGATVTVDDIPVYGGGGGGPRSRDRSGLLRAFNWGVGVAYGGGGGGMPNLQPLNRGANQQVIERNTLPHVYKKVLVS